MAVGCFVSVGRSLDAAVERVKLAEELGYEAAYVTHIAGHEPSLPLSPGVQISGHVFTILQEDGRQGKGRLPR